MEIWGAVDAHRPADRIRNQEHFDKQIKSLMELKTKLMEQSQKIREKKMDDKTKADLLKNLNDQMNQIDQTINQINQEKMKANKEEKDASDKEVESGASPAAESESYIPSKMGLLLQANLHHSSIHRMGSTRQRLENDSAGLQGEIRLGRIQIERDEPVIRENAELTTFRRKNEQITNIQSKIYALNDRISEEYGHLHKALNDAGRLHKKETEPRVNGKEGESKETGGENKDPSTDSAANGSNESQTETKAKTSVDVYV